MTRKERRAPCWFRGSKRAGRGTGKSVPHVSEAPRGDSGLPELKTPAPCRQEKCLNVLTQTGTVPQTDTGGQVEQTKALGRNHVKELGKMTP